MTMPQIGNWRGVPAKERDSLIDSLRGFAFLFVLFIGIFHLGSPVLIQNYFGLHSPTLEKDGALFWVLFLVDEKFMTLFCLLIGWGLIQMDEKEKQRGRNPFATIGRRQAVLIGLGLIHGFFIWSNDTLFYFGILSLVALPFIHLQTKKLLIIALVCIAVLPACSLGSRVISNGMTRIYAITDNSEDVADYGTTNHFQKNSGDDDEEEWENIDPSFSDLLRDSSNQNLGLFFTKPYADGPAWKVFIARPIECIYLNYRAILDEGLFFLGMILLGMWSARVGFFEQIRKGGKKVWTLAVALTGIGVILSAITTLPYFGVSESFVAMDDLANIFMLPSLFILAGGYLFFFATLYSASRWVGAILAPLGRVSLTAYLMQSFVCTAIFYPYGFGLYGKLSPRSLLLIALGITLLQVALAHIWLRFFQRGPIEALLRGVTYFEFPPKRKLLPPPLPKMV